jgi:Rod binding domain-containing protein
MKISEIQAGMMNAVKKTESSKAAPEQDARLKESAQKLEGLFLSHVLKVMRKTIPKESSQSANMVDMMFSSVMGEGLARQGGIGMTKFLYESLAENDIQAVEKLKNSENTVHSLKFNINSTGSRNE